VQVGVYNTVKIADIDYAYAYAGVSDESSDLSRLNEVQ